MARATSKTPKPDAADLTIKDLLAYRVHRAANLISRSAATRYRADFGVSLAEWRTIALLGARAPLSLNELAREAGLDKGQISRVITGLADRKLVLRELASEGGLAVRLTLTRQGRTLYRGLIDAAAQRNAFFLACLTPEEQRHFDSALAKLTSLARSIPRPAAAAPRAGRVKK